MRWYNCKDEPPILEGEYEVLVLDNDHWAQAHGKIDKNGVWWLWLDGFGWSGDSGYEVYYWCTLPPLPPLPNAEPLCESFCYNYCLSQKNIPRCFCKGDKNKCECKEN